MNQAAHGKLELQTAPNEFVSAATVSLGFPLVFPVAFAFEHFGVGVLQARMVMVIFILFLLTSALVLIRGLFGTKAALLTGLLLATFPILYGDGKSVLGEIPGLFYLFAFLISLWRIEAEDFEGLFQYLFAGFFAGLCVATKPLFLLLLPAIFSVVILYRKRIAFRWGMIAAGLAIFGILFICWVFTQFSFSDSSSATIAHYVNPYGISNIGHTVFTNIRGLFTDSTPLQFLGLSFIWVVGLFLRIRRKTAISLAEAVAFAFAFFVFLAYLRTAGWYRYFFPAHLVALVFAPYSLLAIVEFVRERWQKFAPEKFFRLAPVALISLLAVFQIYLLSFHSFVEGYYTSTTTATLESYFGGLDPKASVFLYNVPEIAIFLPSQNYYQYLQPTDYIETGADQLHVLQNGSADFVIVPETTDLSALDLNSVYKKNVRVDRYRILSR
jgi:4-amino-4-deoxy-L-arabinose transferase-like glycosyltransferase